MALIKCRECKNEISTEAKECPNCGAPVKKPRKFGCLWILIIVLIGVFYYISTIDAEKITKGVNKVMDVEDKILESQGIDFIENTPRPTKYSESEELKSESEQDSFSMNPETIKTIFDTCNHDSHCANSECDKLFPENSKHSAKCFIAVNKYQVENEAQSGDSKEQASPPSTGSWRITRWTSEMDSSKAVQVSLYSENVITDWLNKTHRPSLLIRCLENKTDVIVRTEVSVNPELGLYNEYTVRVRLDSGKPFTQRWSESTNNVALFAPNPIKLAKQINKSKTMLFEFTPFQTYPQTANFQVEGLEYYLKELAETCNWKL